MECAILVSPVCTCIVELIAKSDKPVKIPRNHFIEDSIGTRKEVFSTEISSDPEY